MGSSGQRQPLVALLALLAPVLLIVGIWFGGHPQDLPRFMRGAFVADHQTEVVNVALDRIANDYYRPLKKSQLAGASIAGAVASLHDRFSHYLTPSEYHDFGQAGSFSGVGIEVQVEHRGLLIEQVFDSSPAKRAGLRQGELIIAVNSRKLEGLSSSVSTGLVMGPPGSNVNLTLERDGHDRTVTVTRATVSVPVIASKTTTVKGTKLGVVALSMFSSGSHAEVRTAIESELHAGVRGLALDLRHNGGGLVREAQLIASIFLAKGEVIVTTRGRTQPTIVLHATGGAIPSSIPIVVLVDRDTASASEILTAALQDHHRAIVVGTHTFGKGVFQEVEELPSGGALDITVGEYFTPNGRNLGGGGVNQGPGITPNVLVAHGVDSTTGLQVALDTLLAQVK